jgi:membrane protein YdbS with pleckstrin-like domain
MSGLIGILISLLVFCIVAGVLWYVVSLIPLQPPWGNVARAIFGLIMLLFLLGFLMRAFGSGGRFSWGY